MPAALVPAMPAPRITTLAALTPVAPPSSLPLPPLIRSRKYAPTCGARRPAISLMGASSGLTPVGSLDGLVGQTGGSAVDQGLRSAPDLEPDAGT